MTIALAPIGAPRLTTWRPSLPVLALVMLAITAAGSVFLWKSQHRWLMPITALQTLVYAAAAFAVSRRSDQRDASSRRTLIVILAAAAAMRVLLVGAPPVSTDIFRYVWDGRTQSHGLNPYTFVPHEVALYPQRDQDIYVHINRKDWLKTPYPPAAQWVFAIAARFGESVMVMKLAMVLIECLTVWGLLRMMRRRHVPPERVLLYAWNPLVIWEIAGSGHTEAIGIAFMILAMVAADAGKLFVSGLAFGAAALAKFFPLAAAPAVYQRWDWRMPAGTVLAMLVLYAPYLGEGFGALGSIGDYAHEVGADTGKAFFILSWLERVVPLAPWGSKLYLGLSGCLLLLAGLLVIMRVDRHRSAPTAALMLLTAFQIVMSPHYPWYFTWAVPFLCFRISVGVIWLTGAAPLLYEFFTPMGPLLYAVVFVPFFLILFVEVLIARIRPPPQPRAMEAAAARA